MILSTINKHLLHGLLIISLFIIPILCNIYSITDPYSFWHIAYLEDSKYDSHLSSNSFYDPIYIIGSIILYHFLSQIPGIPVTDLQFLPIPGMLLSIIYCSFARKFSNSNLFIVIITLIMLNIPSPMEFLSLWPHGFGYLLFILFLFVIHKFHQNQSPRIILLLSLIFMSIHFCSYTAELWALSFIVFYNIIIGAYIYIYKAKQLKGMYLINLALSFLVITLSFNKLLYNELLPVNRFLYTISESALSFLSYYSLHEAKTPYIFQADHDLLLQLSGFLHLSLLIALVFFDIILNAKNDICLNIADPINYFRFSLLVVGIMDIIIYGSLGVITLRYIYFIFPLFILFLLKNERFSVPALKHGLYIIITIILISASIHSYLSIKNEIYLLSPTSFKEYKSSAIWLTSNSVGHDVLNDVITGSNYLLMAACYNSLIVGHLINIEIYDAIVNFGELSDQKIRYLAINVRVKKIISNGWLTLGPFKKYTLTINNNRNINKIYNDNLIWIFYLSGVAPSKSMDTSE